MDTPGCHTEFCTFHGPESAAQPGKCTGVQGYISNYEIRDLIAVESNIHQYSSPEGDILVYDNIQWVSWMTSATYQDRVSWIKGLNFGGTVDWAIDLNQTYEVSQLQGPDGSLGSGIIYIDPDIWKKPNPTLSCLPPCTFVMPPWVLSTTTTISIPPTTITLLNEPSPTTTRQGVSESAGGLSGTTSGQSSAGEPSGTTSGRSSSEESMGTTTGQSSAGESTGTTSGQSSAGRSSGATSSRSSEQSTSETVIITISIPPITTTEIPVWNLVWSDTILTPYPTFSLISSIVPPPIILSTLSIKPLPPPGTVPSSPGSPISMKSSEEGPFSFYTYLPGPYPPFARPPPTSSSPTTPSPVPLGSSALSPSPPPLSIRPPSGHKPSLTPIPPPGPPPPGMTGSIVAVSALPDPTQACHLGRRCGLPCIGPKCWPKLPCIGICGCIGFWCHNYGCIGPGCLDHRGPGAGGGSDSNGPSDPDSPDDVPDDSPDYSPDDSPDKCTSIETARNCKVITTSSRFPPATTFNTWSFVGQVYPPIAPELCL